MQKAIQIEYNDIIAGTNLNKEIFEAFGEDGLGLILIKGVSNFQEKRHRVLNAIKDFGYLSKEVQEKYSSPESNYSFGWSHGKEKMAGGRPDLAKGSYYANPLFDQKTEDDELKKKFAGTYTDNIWPTDDLPELEPAFKDMSKVQLQIGFLLCKLFDRFLNQRTEKAHKLNTFHKMISKSNCCKGRMLHYFPLEQQTMSKPQRKQDIDNLCGWHLDHGGITALVSPLYLNEDGEQIPPPQDCGLYVKTRKGVTVKVDIPQDCIAIQLGEMLQFFSGGLLRATPHCVRASNGTRFSREQFVLFMDCKAEQQLHLPKYSLNLDLVLKTPYLPKGVPELKSRIKGAQLYRDFVQNTYKAYSVAQEQCYSDLIKENDCFNNRDINFREKELALKIPKLEQGKTEQVKSLLYGSQISKKESSKRQALIVILLLVMVLAQYFAFMR